MPDGADPAAGEVGSRDLDDAALECGYERATVVELCRFFHDRPRLDALDDNQAAEMADRLRRARERGISDARWRALATEGLGMGDLPRLLIWSWCSRAADGHGARFRLAPRGRWRGGTSGRSSLIDGGSD